MEENHVFFHHSYGIFVDTFKNNSNLTNFFKIVATANDINNKTTVAAIEAYKYPFFAS